MGGADIITSSGKAQSPERVLKQATKALGGAMAIKRVKTTDALKLGGGLLGAVKPGPMLVFEQARINNESGCPLMPSSTSRRELCSSASASTRLRDSAITGASASKRKGNEAASEG